MFKTTVDKGMTINREERDALSHFYGPNRLPEPERASVVKMLLAQLIDFMVIILIIATVTSAALGEYKSAIVLLVVIVANVIIGFTQEYNANKKLEALLSLSIPKVRISVQARLTFRRPWW